MATLNEIAYNIKELMSGGDEKSEQNISTKQIKHWVHYHRAKIIQEKLTSGDIIDRRYIQPIKSILLKAADVFDTMGNLNAINSVQDTKGFSNTHYYGENSMDGKEFNTFVNTIPIPHTINIGQNDGLTDVRLKRRVDGFSGAGRWSSWAKIPIKTKDEAMFGWANKFTNVTTPYVVPYNSVGAVMNLEIGGLRHHPVDNDDTNSYEYMIDIWGILTNPTLSQDFQKEITGGVNISYYDDATSYYPITEEDLPLLVSRVAEVEITLILKTPTDLVEDNVDTSKINIGGEQRQ